MKEMIANAESNRKGDFDFDEYGFRSLRFVCRSMIYVGLAMAG
jgi:hypothetical protein